jgi:hypothetical protein
LKKQTEGLSQPGGVLEIKSLGRAAIFSKNHKKKLTLWQK